MPCERSSNGITKVVAKSVHASEMIPKTIYGCIAEAHESKSQQVEFSPPKKHEDQIAGNGFTSISHKNLVQKFIPMPQVMDIQDAKAVVDKEWEKLETIPAWQLDKVKNKKEVILEAHRDKKKVHFATLMDTCHLKNAELQPKLQKYKGRVVLR